MHQRVARGIVALACLVTAVAWAAPEPGCELRVRSGDNPPYHVTVTGAPPAGFHADLIREAGQRMGCTVRFEAMTFGAAMEALRRGTVDVVVGAFPTPERRAFARFSSPVNQSANALYLRRQAPGQERIQRLGDLRGSALRVGVNQGSNYSPEYTALLDDPAFRARLVPVATIRNAWQDLQRGRLDGVISDENSALWHTANLQWPLKVNTRPIVISVAPSHVAFSRATVSEQRVDQFNVALAAMIADGAYARLRERYIPCRTDPDTLGCAAR